MEIKLYEKELPKEAKEIRISVFVKEQGFKEEFDSTDSISSHLVAFDGEKAAGTCRYYVDEKGDYYLGRLAVMKEYRGKGVGAALVEIAEKSIISKGGKSLKLHSQLQAKNFYEKQGYEAYGEKDFDEGCEHIWMEKKF